MYKIEVGFADICEAYTRIKPYIVKTPLIKSDKLSEFAGSDVWFKLENMQPIGAYKLRGAMNNMLAMSREDLARGVVAASAGNHSQAVAYAARMQGASAVVCVPESTPMNKRESAIRYGAELVV